jgi:hypothetical protein
VPYSTLPTSLREYQETHARCRSRTTYSATIAVTLNIDRPLYIARIQALSHQGRTPASRFHQLHQSPIEPPCCL